MDAARDQGHECSVESITTRLLFTSFASIHTTSASFTAALFELCQHPEVADELRKEIKPVIDDGGWSKDGFDRMPKLDSFIKEALRMHPQSLRMSLHHFYTFTNPTFPHSLSRPYRPQRFYVPRWYCSPEGFHCGHQHPVYPP